MTAHPLARYIPLLIEGDERGLRDLCAVESVVTAWGRSPLPHQAAAAVYERAYTGLLSEVRIYDDVDRPALTH